jgi:hypothetical protein
MKDNLRLDEKWTKTTPKVGPNGSGFFSQRKAAARTVTIDDFSADYLMSIIREERIERGLEPIANPVSGLAGKDVFFEKIVFFSKKPLTFFPDRVMIRLCFKSLVKTVRVLREAQESEKTLKKESLFMYAVQYRSQTAAAALFPFFRIPPPPPPSHTPRQINRLF